MVRGGAFLFGLFLLYTAVGCRGKVSGSSDNAVERSLAIEKAIPEIVSYRPGDELVLKAVLNFTVVSQNVSEGSSWTVADDKICVLVENPTIDGQRVLIRTVGECTVTVSFEGLSASINLPVSGPIVTGLQLSMETLTLNLGEKVTIAAEAVYDDGSKLLVSPDATYTCSQNPCHLESHGAGVFSAKSVGEGKITASYGEIAKEIPYKVSAARLTDIKIGQFQASMNLGVKNQFFATAVYSDGAAKDVTAAAKWTSSDPSVVAVSNDAGQEGAYVALKNGSSTIKASFLDRQANQPMKIRLVSKICG